MNFSELKVLIKGYAKKTKDGWLASSTTALIEDSGKKIIVDPGINKELLLKKLQEEKLKLIWQPQANTVRNLSTV